MLHSLQPQSPDALLALIKLYAEDDRPDKIDLGVGVYRTDDGDTPVFSAIKEAEERLVREQDSKSYLGPEGDMGFVHVLMPYIFGKNPMRGGRIEGMQTPGGTGAVRLALALAQAAGVGRVLLGTPSWPNHQQILNDMGIETHTFVHATRDGTPDMDALRAALNEAGEGDAVLLHASCHNPSGIDYSPAQWDEIADLLVERKVLPIIDCAYHGLGEGMEQDVDGLRTVIDRVPEALVSYSCDKNFGLYRDRVGALYVLARETGDLAAIFSNANAFARAAWSMPPDHGAAAVRYVLRDPALTKMWLDEVEEMRLRMREMREILAAADNRVPGMDLAPLGQQNGLFATLPLDKAQIQSLRDDHAVYMAGSGRINIAGLTSANIQKFIDALADVTG